MKQKYAFLDRDGTLIYEPQDTCQIDSIAKLKILPGVIKNLQLLQELGYKIVMVTNQNGVGTASFPQADFDKPQAKLLDLLAAEGIKFTAVFVCPHFPEDECDCRKPKTALVEDFIASNQIDLANSFMCGDRATDQQFAENLGIRFVPTKLNGPFEPFRMARVQRATTETQIDLTLNLDGTGQYQVDTDIGFLNHMLELFARHGLFDLKITGRGDTQVDDHHLIEDVGICLGQAIKAALADKRGINRYGSILLPMDEVLIACAVDLSGRFAFQTNYQPVRDRVNDFSTEMVYHFFESLAVNAGLNLHLQFLNPGRNEHHRIEASFKSFARALRQASELDPRAANSLPTTKSSL